MGCCCCCCCGTAATIPSMDSFVDQSLSGPRLLACSLAPRYSSEAISSATISLLCSKLGQTLRATSAQDD